MPRKLSRRSLATYVTGALVQGTHRTKVVKQLAAYLIESGRTKELDLIVRDVNYNLSLRGVINATLTSAFDLEVETKKSIERFIAAHANLAKASKVSIDTMIEPSVLGGVKISLPGRELDQTILHQLTTLKTRFKKA